VHQAQLALRGAAMTYHASLDFHAMGVYQEPHITCDGCGVVYVIKLNRRGTPNWLLNHKAPKGWSYVRDRDGGKTKHYCPECKP